MLSDDRVVLSINTNTPHVSLKPFSAFPKSESDTDVKSYLAERQLPRNITRVLCRGVEEPVQAARQERRRKWVETNISPRRLHAYISRYERTHPVPATLSILITTFLALPYGINTAKDRVSHCFLLSCQSFCLRGENAAAFACTAMEKTLTDSSDLVYTVQCTSVAAIRACLRKCIDKAAVPCP